MKSNKVLRRQLMEAERLYKQAMFTIMALALQAGGEIRVKYATAVEIDAQDELVVGKDEMTGDTVFTYKRKEPANGRN